MFFITLFFILIFGVEALPFEARDIIIREVRGNVLMWPIWSDKWYKMEEGKLIPEFTLVQVCDNSSLSFSILGSEKFLGLGGSELTYTVNVPTVFRITPNTPRKIKLDSYFIEKFPDVTSANPDIKESFTTFEEAWKRISVNLVLKFVPIFFIRNALKKEKSDMNVALRAKKIKIYYPHNDSIILSDSLPKFVKISWKAIPVPLAQYSISVWKADEKKPSPQHFTNQTYNVIKFEEEGDYFFQVSSSDGVYQSSVNKIGVFLPMAGRKIPPSPDSLAKKIELVFPYNNFKYFTKSFPVTINFVWDKDYNRIYSFVLLDEGKKVLFEKKTTSSEINLKFDKYGSYKWYVKACDSKFSEDENCMENYSELRNFDIELYDSFDFFKAAILSGGKHGIIYFADGF